MLTILNEFLEFLSPGWVGSIIGIVGTLGAVAIYFMTRQRKRIGYCYCGSRLLGSKDNQLPDEITVQFKGINVPRVTQTIIVLWNCGEQTIFGTDSIPEDPLRIELDGVGEILAATMLSKGRGACKIDTKIDPIDKRRLHIDFSFLDSSDGATIELLHTSNSSKINLLGTIIGIPKGVKNFGYIRPKPRIIVSRSLVRISPKLRLPALYILVGAVMFVSAVASVAKSLINHQTISVQPILFYGGTTQIIIGLIFYYVFTKQQYPSRLHVDHLYD